jgi:hypothetical protein
VLFTGEVVSLPGSALAPVALAFAVFDGASAVAAAMTLAVLTSAHVRNLRRRDDQAAAEARATAVS